MCTAAGLLWVLPSSGSLSAHRPVRGWAAGQCWPQSCTQAGSTAHCYLAALPSLQADINMAVGHTQIAQSACITSWIVGWVLSAKAVKKQCSTLRQSSMSTLSWFKAQVTALHGHLQAGFALGMEIWCRGNFSNFNSCTASKVVYLPSAPAVSAAALPLEP